jgi:hypothetical protein
VLLSAAVSVAFIIIPYFPHFEKGLFENFCHSSVGFMKRKPFPPLRYPGGEGLA